MDNRIDFIEEVANWNEVRSNTGYVSSLEYAMLDEELEEFMEAGISGDKVGQADALADILVVAAGGLYKLCGGSVGKVQDILLAVTAANNTKSSQKNEYGKITKPDDFVGPEDMIRDLLDPDIEECMV